MLKELMQKYVWKDVKLDMIVERMRGKPGTSEKVKSFLVSRGTV